MQEYAPLNKQLNVSAIPTAARQQKSLAQWACRHYPSYSEIEAYNMAAGTRQVIAYAARSKDYDAEAVAEFIARAVNNYIEARELIRHMAAALEKCMACKGISWEAEHDADILVRRAEKFMLS